MPLITEGYRDKLVTAGRWCSMGLWALAVAGFLVMTEISRLLAELTVADKPSYPAGALSGWPGFTPWWDEKRLDAVTVWTQVGAPMPAGDGRRELYLSWLRTYLALDIAVFTPAYLLLIHLVIRKIWQSLGADQPISRAFLDGFVIAALVFDWAETGLTFFLVGDLSGDPSAALAHGVAWLSALKWGALALTALFGVLGLARMLAGPLIDWLGRWKQGTLSAGRVWTRHRNQLGVLLVLALLVVVPGDGPLEQLPDIERAWAGHTRGQLVGDLVPPFVALIGFCLALWVVGRWALLDGAPTNRDSRPWLTWTLCGVGAALLVGAFLLHRTDHATPGVYAIPVLMLVLAVCSLPLPEGGGAGTAGEATEFPDSETRPRVRSMGRVLAVLPLVIAGLALVHAFARPYLLGPEIAERAGEVDQIGVYGYVQLLFWIGVGTAALTGPVVNELVRMGEDRWLEPAAPGPAAETVPEAGPATVPEAEAEAESVPGTEALPGVPKAATWLPAILGAVLLAAAIVAGVLLTVWPGVWGPRLRSLGVLVVLLTTVTLVAGWLARRSEFHLPLPALRYLRFRLTPVWLLVIAALVLEAQLDTAGGYHEVRLKPRSASGAAPAAPAQPFDAKASFGAWRAAVQACMDADKTLKPATAVPMAFVAAPGGGIRAAYWTGAAMDEMTRRPCAQEMLFGASGVSGGSLGLVGHGLGPREGKPAASAGRDFAARLSGEDTLASDLAAMFYRDLPRALHGINSLGDLRPGDRATVFERSWENLDERLQDDFFTSSLQSRPDAGPRPVLLLNGTDVNSGCRVVVSSVWSTGGPGGAALPTLNCRRMEVTTPPVSTGGGESATAGFAAGAIDAAAYTDHRDCRKDGLDQGLRLSTAVHLSARFPYISPSGRMHRCVTDGNPQKLADLDGGTLESSGLALLLELWEAVEPHVAAHNRAVAAGAEAGAGADGRYVLPLLVVLDNHYQSKAAAPDAERQQEAVAPLIASRSPKAALSVSTLGQLGLYRFTGALPGIAAAASAIRVDGVACPQVRSFFAAPSARPGIAAPLGWVLSDMSKRDLRVQLRELVRAPDQCREPARPDEPPRQTPSTFSTFLKVLRGPVTLGTG
ncbi:hypothetical protein ABZ572_02605 [Streptomyces sp. NPDC018338]|uniref:hypothetical protein n=1 Tax=Streptomyces sp. NPDC018338 TaxID=3157192 RepID=UPI0033FCE5DE